MPGYDFVLRKMLERDTIVYKHLTIDNETSDEITVRID